MIIYVNLLIDLRSEVVIFGEGRTRSGVRIARVGVGWPGMIDF